jgi:hypothetical protein
LKHNETEFFLKKFASVAKQYAEQSATNKYPQCQNKTNPWKIINIELIPLEKNEDDVHNLIIDYKCIFDIQEKPEGKKSYQTIYRDKEFPFTIEETDLPEDIYRQLVINYFYTLYNLDTTQTYTDIYNSVKALKNKKYFYKGAYFALKYYYEVLNKKPKPQMDFSICESYYNIGLGYFLYGTEWIDYFNQLFNNFFKCDEKTKIQKETIEKNLSKDTLSLIKDYNYNFEDILIALQYYYKILEKPVPDKPNLNIVPYIMEDAKIKVVEDKERQVLLDYIYELFDLDKNSTYPLIQAEIRKYHSIEYGKLTYKGMKSTLDYYYNILGNPLPQRPNVGIIPYQYDNALAFYKQRKAVKDSGNLPSTVPVVRIRVSKEAREQSQRLYEDRYKWKPTKSISEIEVEEDETFDRL